GTRLATDTDTGGLRPQRARACSRSRHGEEGVGGIVRRPLLALLLMAATSAVGAQAPVLPPEWFPNREPRVDAQAVSFCDDPRNPANEVDRTIAEAIASALLVEPRIHVVERQVVSEQEYEGLYIDLIDHCALYLGFKLYSDTYPGWLTLTRPFYQARFVVLTANQE